MDPGDERDAMVLQMRPMAHKLAWRVAHAMRIVPLVSVEDLEQEAMLGVLVAAERWVAERGAWPTYAYIRAMGAIKDYLRSISFGGRGHWREFLVTSLDGARIIDGEEGLTLLDTLASDERPLADLPDPRLPERLAAALRTHLTVDQRTAVALYHEEGLTMGEVGEAMGVSESMVSLYLRQVRQRLTFANVRSELGA